MMKRFFIIFLIFLITLSPSFAASIKTRAYINDEFTLEEVPETVQFLTTEPVEIEESVIIPSGALVTADLYQYQKERRWHKSGFFICKLKNYKLKDFEPIDISKSEFYFIARKFEKLDGKDAAITGTELVLSAAASVFVPGVDIVYFFTKGAIQREKHKNWFKAGVSNAYDNSICWFWLKGRTIELNKGDSINLKEINRHKAEILGIKIERRHKKENLKAEKKAFKIAQKTKKRQLKLEQKHEIKTLEAELDAKEETICNNENNAAK